MGSASGLITLGRRTLLDDFPRQIWVLRGLELTPGGTKLRAVGWLWAAVIVGSDIGLLIRLQGRIFRRNQCPGTCTTWERRNHQTDAGGL